ncbi:MAG: dethiobiotin synthase [Methylococcaceae bacterium]|nr:dethiobiotin synthase [Methylococcaceae bacterium]
MAGIFVAGTDTGVGKTVISAALLRYLRAQGWSAIGMKPVAAGCFREDGELRNGDALELQRASSPVPSYREINPYRYEEPISPYLASVIAGQPVNKQFILDAYRKLAERADWVVVEGAGGWFCPLTEQETMAELASALELPVVLVVGLRLGCVNHALLSEQAITSSGLNCLGWIGNQVQAEFPLADANLADLRRRLGSPCLGHFPFQADLPMTVASGRFPVPGVNGSILLPILRRLSRSVTLPPFECADKPTDF